MNQKIEIIEKIIRKWKAIKKLLDLYSQVKGKIKGDEE